MKKYDRIAKMVEDYPWAMMEGPLEAMLEVLEMRLEGGAFTPEEVQERIGAIQTFLLKPVPKYVQLDGGVFSVEEIQARINAAQPRPQGGTVAVLPVQGIIAHRMNMLTAISGGLSTELLGRAIDQAVADPAVSAIVLDVDSPGGSVFGVQELGDKIFRARGTKPIVAVANATAGSAAYWIASQADEVLVTPSGQVGSIGAMAVHIDRSKQAEMLGVRPTIITFGKNKAEGSDLAPLTDEARADMQRRVNQYGETFVKAVARGRGVPVATVREEFGQGRMFGAADAVKLGMADGLGTLEDVVARLVSGSRSAIAAETPAPPIVADASSADDMTEYFATLRREVAERAPEN